MTTPGFQDHKIERFYAILDTDGDGQLNWNDIQRLADSLIATFHEPPGSAKAHAVNTSFKTFWDGLLQELDRDGDDNISSDEYRSGMRRLLVEGPYFDPLFRPAVEAVGHLCDTDGDGSFDVNEYVAMEAAFGIDSAEARHAFSRLDSNADGLLDVDELVEAARVYYTSDDPDAVGNWLFGRAGR